MHRLLKRQIKKFVTEKQVEQLADFFDSVNSAYQDFEDDNQQLERTLERSSQELIKANLELKDNLDTTTVEARNVTQRLKDVVDNVTEIIFQTDIKGNWTFLNPAWSGITNYSIKESIDRSLSDFVHPDDKDRNTALFESLISGQKNLTRHGIRIMVKGGKHKDIEVFARGFRNENNVLVGTTGTMIDVTEQKKNQEQIKISQSNLEAIVSSLDDIVFEINDEYIINEVWTADEYELPYPKEKIVKTSVNELFDKSSSIKLVEAIDKAIQHHETIKLEYKSLKNNRWYVAKVSWLKSSTEKEQKVSVLLQDITEKKNAEKELKEATDRYMLGVKSAKFGFWDWDLRTNDLVWDSNMYDIFEVDINFKGKLFSLFREMIHYDDVDELFEHVTEAIKVTNEFEHDFRIITGNNTLKHISGRGKVHYTSEGRPISVTGLNWDISKIKDAEENLIKAKEEAEQAAIAKSQFLSTMSHELRTPMNAVVGISNLLLQNNPKKDQVANLKALTFSSNNLLSLINNILDFSKIESERVEFEQIDFNLKELIEGIKRSMSFKAKAKGIDFKVKIEKEVPAMVVGDPTRLSQILNNLLSNAIKFTAKGYVGITILTHETFNKKIELKFIISDTGIGIPKDKMETIFESFSQASSSTTREYGGTGLGLPITKKLIELMDSELLVESKVNKKTTFSFILPFKKSSKSASKESDMNVVDIDGTLGGVKVLLVEDNPVNVLVVKQFLKKWKLEIEEAQNGKIAVEKVKANDYDLVLMDLQMPEMDGYEAAKKIRSMEKKIAQQVPIIALTADAMAEVRAKVEEAGMNDYVLKPFEPVELYTKIKKYTVAQL